MREKKTPAEDNSPERREFLSSVAMVGGLAAGYGTLAVMAGRYLYLYPAGAQDEAWQFVTELKGVRVGEALDYVAPTGVRIVVARRADDGTAADFVALSGVCPHLGCQVHWQPHKNRFFCPCHNGVFDPQGKAIEGPPAAAGQSLAAYPLKVEAGLLFIEVPVVGLGSPEEV
ncbi:MAG: hypothetical protein A2V70_10980 [Planctomycetes bacterium RBG_13_63_9]|nr:MAG: hypothetical protein A2V70_10980 [Planctomycetes bacterium RBG_13_63_9]